MRLYLAVIEHVAVVTLTRGLELLAVRCLRIFSLSSSLPINMLFLQHREATDPSQRNFWNFSLFAITIDSSDRCEGRMHGRCAVSHGRPILTMRDLRQSLLSIRQ